MSEDNEKPFSSDPREKGKKGIRILLAFPGFTAEIKDGKTIFHSIHP